ncbi:CAP domain-containing protein [Streptomyces sp. NPDC006012]|uniref:CAP domain-containing protein n=1 Tax=Streptomyces sp. NPDC006012 TaxID=3364739 RepID=UPI0036CD0DF9
MGRHRRSAAGRATGVIPPRGSAPQGPDPRHPYPDDRASTGTAPCPNPQNPYPRTYSAPDAQSAASTAYLYATTDAPYGPRPDDAHGRQPRGGYGRQPDGEYGRQPGDGYGRRPHGGYEQRPGDGYGRLPDQGYGPRPEQTGARGPGGGGFSPPEFAPFDEDGPRERGHRRKKKGAATVRTGLLGVSAAVALGTVAVATGVLPGLDGYRTGGTSDGDQVRADGEPGNTPTEQGGTAGSTEPGHDGTPGGRATPRPSSSASSTPASSAPAPARTPSKHPTATPSKQPTRKPTTPAAPAPTQRTSAPATVSAATAAEAQVLKLVNEERAKAGCGALTASGPLTRLAEAFSADMAARDFFDHTDPDGRTPWDRASAAGVSGLGGENIARGQADAAAVMEAWMNSPGHRANILNCDFTTLGVGVHFGSGGPWWTQDFGR